MALVRVVCLERGDPWCPPFFIPTYLRPARNRLAAGTVLPAPIVSALGAATSMPKGIT